MNTTTIMHKLLGFAAPVICLAAASCVTPRATSRPKDSFEMDSVRLLVKESDFGRRISARPLSNFIKQLRAEAQSYWSETRSPTKAQLALWVAVKANGAHRIWVTSRPESQALREALAPFAKALNEAAEAPEVSDTIVFVIVGRVGGAKRSEVPTSPFLVPQSWRPKRAPKRLYQVVETLF